MSSGVGLTISFGTKGLGCAHRLRLVRDEGSLTVLLTNSNLALLSTNHTPLPKLGGGRRGGRQGLRVGKGGGGGGGET